jgi:GT2 family glycosyltransferase
MKVDLLVVNYNTLPLLHRFLETINRDYQPDVWTLSIADNGSTDGSVKWLEANKHNYNIDYVIFNENIGYARAINHLASITSSDILCAVNADTWFTTKHVLDMIQCFKENPNIAIAGPKQIDEKGRIRHAGISWTGRKGDKPQHRGWAQYDPKDEHYHQLVRCWTVSGSIYYVRRSVWDAMYKHPEFQKLYPDANGAFLLTPHFFEETFCSQWAQKLGYEVWYNGMAETTGHTWHASSNPGEASKKFFNVSKSIYVQACEALGVIHEC